MQLMRLTIVSLLCLLPAVAHAGNPIAGRQVYERMCSACHGLDGNAAVPGTPNFARGERLEKPDRMLLATLQVGKNLCPSWRGVITEIQMMDVVSYIRTLRRF